MPAHTQALVVAGAIVLALALVLGGGLLTFSYVQARSLLRPVRKAPYCLPADEGLPAEEVAISGPQGKLAAWYVAPRNGCVLICCHGIHDSRSQWVPQIARLRRERGYGALLFDFAGHGESDGSLVTYGVRERDDVAAALAYLRRRGDVDMGRIGILGYSLGAITAVLASAEQPELRAVVIESGFSDLQRDIAVLFHRFTGLPSFPFANLVVFWGQRISGVRLAEIRPERVIGKIAPRAVFIISDLMDSLADEPHDGDRLYAAAGEPRRHWQVADAEHVQAFTVRPGEWIARVGDFLDEYLAARA